MRYPVLFGAFVLAMSDEAAGQPPRRNTPGFHAAVMYSCMTVPADGVPMVDNETPAAVEHLHPGYEIHRFTEFEIPGISLWNIRGARRHPAHEERYAHVEGFDGTRVLEGRELFLRYQNRSAWQLARWSLAVLFRRSDQRPLEQRTAETIQPSQRMQITPPSLQNGELSFWMRRDPQYPHAVFVRIELSTGNILEGNAY